MVGAFGGVMCDRDVFGCCVLSRWLGGGGAVAVVIGAVAVVVGAVVVGAGVGAAEELHPCVSRDE